MKQMTVAAMMVTLVMVWLYPHPTPCFLSLVLLFIVLLSQGCSESHQDEKLPALVGNI